MHVPSMCGLFPPSRQFEYEKFYILLTCISLQILENNQLDLLFHVFIYLFIYFMSIYMFRASQHSSSGDRIVLIHRLV